MTSAMSGTKPLSGLRAAIVIAAAGSAGAGLVHAAAAGTHDGAGSLVWMFALCAAAQLGWAAIAVAAPTRSVLLLGAGINGAAVLTWFLSRTVGLPLVDALREVEKVGTQDLVAAGLGAAAVAGCVIAIVQPVARRTMPASWSAMIVVGTVALVVPAMAAGHAHGGHAHLASEHVHADGVAHEDEQGHDHDDGSATAAHPHDDADHDDSKAHADDHGDEGHDDGHEHAQLTSTGRRTSSHNDDGHHGSGPSANGSNSGGHNDGDGHHGSGPPASGSNSGGHNDGDGHHGPGPTPGPTAPPHPHPGPTPHPHPGPTPTPTGPIVSLDDPRLTTAQRNAGNQLLFTTLAAMAPFPNVQAVEAAGYRSIGDAGTGFEHFVNWTYFNDGIELDPNRIESIVIRIGPNGEKIVASAMYILNLGRSLADVPEIAGTLTTWHDHTNLCWVPNGEGGMRLSGVTDANGNCARGTNIVTPPMLHVWLDPQPCGPFSGIEGTHGDACAHSH
jgi:hypothetical protein